MKAIVLYVFPALLLLPLLQSHARAEEPNVQVDQQSGTFDAPGNNPTNYDSPSYDSPSYNPPSYDPSDALGDAGQSQAPGLNPILTPDDGALKSSPDLCIPILEKCNGCILSPENPTYILALLCGLAYAFNDWKLRRKRRASSAIPN